jgi:hypothetical protein
MTVSFHSETSTEWGSNHFTLSTFRNYQCNKLVRNGAQRARGGGGAAVPHQMGRDGVRTVSDGGWRRAMADGTRTTSGGVSGPGSRCRRAASDRPTLPHRRRRSGSKKAQRILAGCRRQSPKYSG